MSIEMSQSSSMEQSLLSVVNQGKYETDPPQVQGIGQREQDNVGRRQSDATQVFLTLHLLEIQLRIRMQPASRRADLLVPVYSATSLSAEVQIIQKYS